MPGRRTPRSARQPRPPPPNLPIPFRRATAATTTPITTAVPATATATSSRHRHTRARRPRLGATKGEIMTTAALRRGGYLLAALAAIAVTVTVVAFALPSHPRGRAFPPLHPAAPPAGWPRATLPNGTAVLSYPPSLRPLT